jgi:hypothetical protein
MVGGCIVAAVVFVGLVAWQYYPGPQLTGNATSAPQAQTTGRGATRQAQGAAESETARRNPQGPGDQAGGRAQAIQQSSAPLDLSEQQRAQIRTVIANQHDVPREAQANFDLMIGAAVPQQTETSDLPPEVAEIMNGYQGDRYTIVRGILVIVDRNSGRVTAIVPGVG